MGGRCKALLPFRGRPLIAGALGLLREVFGEAVIIAGDPAPYEGLGARVIPDILPGKGPLGGIHAALHGCGGRPVFVAACDMPFLDAGLARELAAAWLRAGRGAALPRAGGFLEPLCAVYGPDLAGPLDTFLRGSSDLSIKAFLRGAGTAVLELDGRPGAGRAFANINSPGDLERLA